MRFEIRQPRWPNVAFLLGSLGLVSVFVKLGFVNGVDADGNLFSLGTKVLFGLGTAVGLFLIGVFARRLVAGEVTFQMDDEGFEYNPGGVSTGRVRWRDVASIEETTVLVGSASLGPSKDLALAVILRDPASYTARQPVALRPLLRLREELSQTPLLIDPRDLGRDYTSVRDQMQELLRR
jgi:hypothetical protein